MILTYFAFLILLSSLIAPAATELKLVVLQNKIQNIVSWNVNDSPNSATTTIKNECNKIQEKKITTQINETFTPSPYQLKLPALEP